MAGNHHLAENETEEMKELKWPSKANPCDSVREDGGAQLCLYTCDLVRTACSLAFYMRSLKIVTSID